MYAMKEEVDNARVVEEDSNTEHVVATESACRNIESPGGLIGVIEESERRNTSDGKDYKKRPHEEELEEESPIEEEVNKSEAETNCVVEVAAEAEITSSEIVNEEEVLFPDAITPSMMLIIFNIILPTVDIFFDAALIQKLLLNDFLVSGVFVSLGIFTNFLFTSLAWWRLEPAKQKNWSWIFLALQLWPQLRAFQVFA